MVAVASGCHTVAVLWWLVLPRPFPRTKQCQPVCTSGEPLLLLGKSSLINCVRGVGPKDATGAPVGVNECTKVVSVYPFGRSLPVRPSDVVWLPRYQPVLTLCGSGARVRWLVQIADLVDMPGAGSEMFPVESYCTSTRAGGAGTFTPLACRRAGTTQIDGAEACLVFTQSTRCGWTASMQSL